MQEKKKNETIAHQQLTERRQLDYLVLVSIIIKRVAILFFTVQNEANHQNGVALLKP